MLIIMMIAYIFIILENKLNILSAICIKAKLYGLNISYEMLNVVKCKNDQIDYTCGSVEKIPYKNNMFDISVTGESFHHYSIHVLY